MPPLKSRLARVLPFFAGSRIGFAVAIAASIVGAATEPLIPALLKPLLDRGFQQGALPLWAIPVALIGLFAVRGLAGFVGQYALSWASNRGIVNMRRAMFERLLTAQPLLFTQKSASSLTNTLVYEVQSGANLLAHSLLSLLKEALTLVALLGYLLWLNWQLTLFVAVLVPAIAIVMRVLSKRLHRLTVAGQSATDELAYVVEENVLAWRIVRLHGAAKTEATRFGRTSELLRRLTLKSTVAASTMTPVTQVLAACAMSAVISIALWQSATTGGSVGSFVAFVTAMLMLVAPIKHLSEIAGPVTRGLAAVERGISLIDDTLTERGGGHDPGRASGHMELRGVTLRYRDQQSPALSDVSLELQPGETVALVGPSGAGKSTLVNLLPRFIEPSAGELRLDGQPLAQWDITALRRQFALVSQDVVLFNDTIAENVCLGDDLDRERVREAGRPRGVDERPHLARDRAPPVDDPARRPHRRAAGGRVVEQGTHAELIARGGLYARLHALQFRS